MTQAHRCKLLLVLIDGLGDVSIDPSIIAPASSASPPLTTLQAASMPHMDALAASGVTGLMDPVEPGLACGRWERRCLACC
jgi:2,3-bisphosphoglycerate-independent phosphoglycerate mutase